jgi:hypothetical protein
MWSFWEKNTCWIVGVPGILGTRGYYEVYKITILYSILSLCPISEKNYVMMLGLHLWDFCCWSMSCHSFQATSWFFERKLREIWSLKVHKTRIIKFDVCKDLDVEITLVITFFLFQDSFKNSYWIYIPNPRDFHSRNHLSFFFSWHCFIR